VDEAVKKWFMDTAARKWKDYKANLKEKFFDETLTDEQMKEILKNILNDDDINDLIKFWRSSECQVRNSSYESLFFHYLPMNVQISMISTIGSQ